ncbi:hypothetical protein I4U23_019380 [Adineta vaga]|nr:hypothetical protein I4U23_019380 [Adineta vaga]
MMMSSEEYWNIIPCHGPITVTNEFPLNLDDCLFTDEFNANLISIDDDFEEISSSSETEHYLSQASSTSSPPQPVDLICNVCGAPAHGYNFDQITCESCKAFFRRNALKNITNFKCRYSGNCVINVHTRRQCAHCRLKKCFDINMRKDWIRTEEERALRLLKNYQKEQRKLNGLPPNHQLFDKLPIVVRKKKRIVPITTTPTQQKVPIPKTELSLEINPFGIHRNLASEDQILLNNIISMYKYGADRADCSHINRYTKSATLTQFVNDESVNHQSLVYFYKFIPEFKQFELDDQILLIKCNMLSIIHLHLIIVENFHENPRMGEHMPSWITPDFHRQMSRTRGRFDRFMKHPHILQIALIVFIFSMNLSIPRGSSQYMHYKNRRKLYEIQNFYVSLLWRYLIYLFDEQEAQRSMSIIVMQILRYQLLMDTMDKAVRKTGQADLLNPLMKSVFGLT